MTGRPSLSSDRILLVEGQDDRHVIRHLRDRHQLKSNFCIKDKEGIRELLDSINPEIKVPGRRAVGILVDANDNLNERWQAITNQLLKANVQAPLSPDPMGAIIDGLPRVGIWLMPDNTASGELEDFIIQMIPTGDPVWPLSQGYIDGIPEVARTFAKSKTRRAELHAWLATRKDPRKMGLAIGARDLNISGTLCQKFLAWLKKLFA